MATSATPTEIPEKEAMGCENPIQELLKDRHERDLAGGDYTSVKADVKNYASDDRILLLEGCHEPGKHSERVEEGVRLILKARANKDFKFIADNYTFQNENAREYLRDQFVRQSTQRKIDDGKYIKAQNWLDYYEAMKAQLVLDLDAACNNNKNSPIPIEKIRALKLLTYRDFSNGNIESTLVKEGMLANVDIVPRIEAISQSISEIRALHPNQEEESKLAEIEKKISSLHDSHSLEEIKKTLEGMKSQLQARASETRKSNTEIDTVKNGALDLVAVLERISDLSQNEKTRIAELKTKMNQSNPSETSDSPEVSRSSESELSADTENASSQSLARLQTIKRELEEMKSNYITQSRTALLNEINKRLSDTADTTLKSQLEEFKKTVSDEKDPLTFSNHRASLAQLTSSEKPKSNGALDLAIHFMAGLGFFDGLNSVQGSDGKPSFLLKWLVNLCNSGDVSAETAGLFGIIPNPETQAFEINSALRKFLKTSPRERFTAMGLSEEKADTLLETSLVDFLSSNTTPDEGGVKEFKILHAFLAEQGKDMSDDDKKITLASYLSPKKNRENLFAYWNFRQEKLNPSSQPPTT
ncbi:hypothetical protein HYV57_02260 [Candidatus Peregrinibacteria bacterium]|nr:hypothetical protein [Candidatus Peregrinibacteria bacterium]